MNQLCKVCGEPAAGFHFGAFTCEGCKSFFGRTYNNISAIAGCKNNGDCVINKKNRTACKACRLRKCLLVGMSKSGSRYGRRSNWFKIHCLLQEQQSSGPGGGGVPGGGGGGGTLNAGNAAPNFEQLARLHQLQARQTYQDKTNPCIKSARISPTAHTLNAGGNASATAHAHPPTLLSAATKFLNGVHDSRRSGQHATSATHHLPHYSSSAKSETLLSDTPSDSGASSAGDAADDARSSVSGRHERNCNSALHPSGDAYDDEAETEAEAARVRRHQQLLQIYRSHSEPLRTPFSPFSALHTHAPPPPPLPPPPLSLLAGASGSPPAHLLPAALKQELQRVSEAAAAAAVAAAAAAVTSADSAQDEPIDLSFKSCAQQQQQQQRALLKRRRSSQTVDSGGRMPASTSSSPLPPHAVASPLALTNVIHRPSPLDLTLVRSQTLTG